MKSVLQFNLLIIIALISCSINTHAQTNPSNFNYPKDYFISPMNIPLLLSGNFGELRNNHFHAGIDIKTQGVTGLPIKASAEGSISRIKIQHYGYGKVLYIDHPNGYTTVYAHLEKFSPKIEAYIKKLQYKNQSYEMDVNVEVGEINLTKGETIAFSGNTGGSGGPHLHFEIRETKTEVPVNPLLFGLEIIDNIPPVIKGIRIYPINNQSMVNQSFEPIYLSVDKKNNDYILNTTPMVHGKIGFGIETIDHLNGSHNRCGVFDINLFIDSSLIFTHNTEKIPFNESRYINAHTDYQYKQQNNKWIHKSYILPNNELSTYKTVMFDGTYEFTNSRKHEIKYIISDAYGNKSELRFEVLSVATPSTHDVQLPTDFIANFDYFKENKYTNDNIIITIPPKALYENLNFSFKEENNTTKPFSKEFYIGNEDIPLHSDMEISFLINPSEVKNEKQLVAIREVGSRKYTYNVTYKNGKATFNSRYFGKYYLGYDVTPPSIKTRTMYEGADVSKKIGFSLIISDDLSGIKSYNCFVDGKWILMEYEYKQARLTHYFDDTIVKGKTHQLKLIVTDDVGNESTYSCSFYY